MASAPVQWTLHAVQEALADGLDQQDVEDALQHTAEVVEDYPHDIRGPSCLALAFLGDGRPVHAVIGCGRTPLVMVTVYRPDLAATKSSSDFRRRMQP